MKKKEYLLYSYIDYVAETIIAQLEENPDEDVSIRMNTGGGDVFAGWGIIAKMNERKGKVDVKVDGLCASMGISILLYADTSQALDTSRFMMHRASGTISSPEEQALLDSINKDLRDKLEAKVDAKLFKTITGISIKDMFEGEEQVDVWINAKQAKQLGLIDTIVKLNPNQIKALNTTMFAVAASLNTETEKKVKPKKSKKMKMSAAILKAKFPKTYAKLQKALVAEERERVGALLPFVEVDAKAVKKAIASGKPITETMRSELMLKAQMNPTLLASLKKDANGNVVTAETEIPKTEKEKALLTFESEVKADLGLNKSAVKLG